MAAATGRVAAYRLLRGASSQLVPKANRLSSLEVQRLTRDFLAAKASYARDSVGAVLRMGAILRRGKELLVGEFCRWLKSLATASSTASDYMAVAGLESEEPQTIRAHAEIGVLKLARLSRLTAAGRRRIVARMTVADLIRLTKPEFLDLTRPYLETKRHAHRGPTARTMLRRVEWLQEALHDARRVRSGGPVLARALRRLAARARVLCR